MAPANGSMLGFRYTLDQRIGAGGYSEVWRAHDSVLDRPVAIKLLQTGQAQSAETLMRFRNEAQLAGQLAHVNVARIYDFSDTGQDAPPYLVMELIDGPSLAEVLQRGPLSPADTMDVLAQAAAGLQAAHAAGLVHRDIKPANIMLAPGRVVKITDFGVSHTLGSAPITSTGLLIGTPGYLAPERAAGARATQAGDLYALGVVGYECLSGAPPFTGSPLEVTLAHKEHPFPPLPGSTPAAVAELIERLTAKDPADRPAGAGLVAQRAAELHAALSPQAYAGPPRTRPDDAGPSVAPIPESVPGSAANSPTLVTMMPTGEALDQPPRPRRRAGLAIAALAAAAIVAVGAVALAGLGSGTGGTPAATRPSSTPASSPGTQAVDVQRATLIGERVRIAVGQLLAQGFRVRVMWQPTRSELPDRVIAVRPAGPRPPGSVITVVAAFWPVFGPGSHDDRGHGHGGNGNGHGNGDG